MHTCQAPALANIMMRNETWLHNLTMFIRYTTWIYGSSIKGFYAHAKTKCLEKSRVVFKFYRHFYIAILKKDICNKRTKKKLVVIHHYYFLFNFEHNNL